jgi:protocatechuate 3,4-dioxygenase beta subunit
MPVTAISTDSGEFHVALRQGSWLLSAEADGYAAAQQQVQSPSTDLRLLLSPDSVIEGRVVRKGDGQPVAGVLVTAKKSDPPYSERSALSDANGAFELRRLPAGTHHLEALGRAFRGQRVSVDVGAADIARRVELEVERSSTVEGTIRVGGAPCAAGMLELLGAEERSAGADAAGRVEINGVMPGEYDLIVSCPSALAQRERLVVRELAVTRVWELDSGIVVRGVVESAAGRPLADALVTWSPRAAAPSSDGELALTTGERSCSSDANGEFACAGLEAELYVGSLTVQGTGQSRSVELDLRGSREVPRVRLQADAAAAIRVQLEPGAVSAADAVFVCSAEGGAMLARRDGERFELRGLPLGAYHVHVGSSECQGALGAEVTLEHEGQVAEVSLSRPRAATVRGRLVDTRGMPVGDAWVRASDTHPAWALLVESAPAVLTDGEGAFTLAGLLPGHYELVARAPFEAGVARQPLELAPGEERELRLVLDPQAPANNTSPPLVRHETNNTE